MWWPRKISGLVGFSSNNYIHSAWISHCKRCGELLATDKPSLLAAHERWCISQVYEQQPPPAGGPANNTALAVLAIAGMAAGLVLSMLALA